MPDLPKQPRPVHTPAIRQARTEEHSLARQARTPGDRISEWAHLERARILSQPLVVAHIRTHLAMLDHGIRYRDRHEIAGQLLRLLVAGPGSALGRYPVGNTGGANVSAVAPMPICDLHAVLVGTTTVSS